MTEQYIPAEARFQYFKNTLTSSEGEYAEDCMNVLRMAAEQGLVLTIDLEESLPPVPFNISERQGYMIRQTLLDLAIQLEEELKDG